MLNLKNYKQSIKAFLDFIKGHQKLAIKLALFFLLLTLIPSHNFYATLNIPSGRPVVRGEIIDLPEPGLYPINTTGIKPPQLSANSALIVDVPSKTFIFAKNPDFKLMPASTTKIMTALVALDHFRLDEVIEVKDLQKIGQTMELVAGEKITVKNLLYGLLVQSGNDAAYVFAQNYPGGLEAFVQKMNEKAQNLHLFDTYFTNPAGIEGNNHYTTSHDLAVLASFALENDVFSQIVATPEIEVYDISFQIRHQLKNINELVSVVPGVRGIKTGWTTNAGECLVSYVQRDKGEIITVVLNSQDRFGETTKLIDWVYDNFEWQTIQPSLD
jgi:serine-type D-Ala-D-Ala carboxypeptidase (penicillin-binding protein 5/6)